jgi:hypothetical protein
MRSPPAIWQGRAAPALSILTWTGYSRVSLGCERPTAAWPSWPTATDLINSAVFALLQRADTQWLRDIQLGLLAE